ncbi:YbaY family lipoprotein [Vibrio hannami]|uniref:YbaY family lipoprotein n=1 Tax=Vibrio hannami TaxID=2717094 RepID=UPI00240EE37D|nr:YbaY family lipoprotein [Vibrio hannami]MDG3088581.1 YbaY family lipoprotein [Vibrio hannami]
MKKTLIWFASVLLAMALVGCESTKQEQPVTPVEPVVEHKEPMMKAVKGMIAYRERIALPDTAVVIITLEDVSLMDAPAKVLAKQTFTTEGEQVPFDFELSYDANEIEKGHHYNIRASIKIDGKLRFTTDTENLVITDKKQTTEVSLMLIGVR